MNLQNNNSLQRTTSKISDKQISKTKKLHWKYLGHQGYIFQNLNNTAVLGFNYLDYLRPRNMKH